jgi:hypothetical protein
MWNLGLISFATPWVLAATAALPIVWLLLRLTPPAVLQVNFPAVRLLFGLDPTQRTAAHTPPWLILLRLAILILALLGLADPALNLKPAESSGTMIAVVDNGWASAANWEERVTALRGTLDAAERRGQSIVLLATAQLPTSKMLPVNVLESGEAAATAAQVVPHPWPTDHMEALRQLEELTIETPASVIWISDGLGGEGAAQLAAKLDDLGDLTVIDSGPLSPPLILHAPERKVASSGGIVTNNIVLKLTRVTAEGETEITETVRAVDTNNQVLARATMTFAAGATTSAAILEMPSELANRIARFDVEGRPGSATTILADDQWQRRPVGVVQATAQSITAPLLENSYYIDQALSPFAAVRMGDMDELFSRPLAVLIMAEGGRILDEDVTRLSDWIWEGGVLVRFAGPLLTENVDVLLPVSLRSGGRTLGGAMSWSERARLAPFPENSPFKGLVIPADVTVSSQVLAEPAADLASKTWARLGDGTPLVTAEQRGQGWIVLFHITATPEWSALPLSGLFVEMLRQVVDVSRGIPPDAPADATGFLAPHAVMDGFGRLRPPGPTVTAIDGAMFNETRAAPHHPPGLYGPPGGIRALNLSDTLRDLEPLTQLPIGTTQLTFTSMSQERVLKPWLLTAALLLLLTDLVISFVLRQLIPEPSVFLKRGAAAGTAAALLLFAWSADLRAADDPSSTDKPIEGRIQAAILETRLAYVTTGSADIDRVAAAGLDALTQLLAARTAAELATPTRINLTATTVTKDALTPYPLIYWRVTPSQGNPSTQAIDALNHYLHSGGTIVFDAPDQTGALGSTTPGANENRLDQILHLLDVPPLMQVPQDHVLTRSFYLLNGMPGRYANTSVLIESASTENDGVSSVVIGGNDWAAAWARDSNGIPLYSVVPGGERQRELAYRAGVNLVMYALTGNYKGDQVHLPSIMERLTQ